MNINLKKTWYARIHFWFFLWGGNQ